MCCVWHGSRVAKSWFNGGSVECLHGMVTTWCSCVWFSVSELCVTLFRCGSVVRGVVQMWFRCVWASVVGSG